MGPENSGGVNVKSRRGLNLDRVVLLGRTFEEYVHYFGLNWETWRGRDLLDVASGVSSFCSEANLLGGRVTACDPIYAMPPEVLRPKCEEDLDHVLGSIGGLTVYRWEFYKNPAILRGYRERAFKKFLADFQVQPPGRYVRGSLPVLPFPDRQFELSLVSYFLFVYGDHFDLAFHRAALVELMRVTRCEARVYPLVTFEGEQCPYLDALRADPALGEFELEEIATDFEFLVGSNAYLRITRRSSC